MNSVMHRAAMLDFDLKLTEVPLSFPVGFPISGGISDGVSGCELGNSDFWDQIERTMLTWTQIIRKKARSEQNDNMETYKHIIGVLADIR